MSFARVEMGLPGTVYASPDGAALLATEADLQQIATRFSEEPVEPERIFEHIRIPGLEYVGMGMYSVAYALGDVVLKASTATTGRRRSSLNPGKPDNVTAQSMFLERMGTELAVNAPDSGVVVPGQYFSVRTPRGDYLQGIQYMRGWIGMDRYFTARRMDDGAAQAAGSVVKQRLKEALDRTSATVRMGANDLGLEDNELLHACNVLIPAQTRNVEGAPLCIIDQPRRSLRGVAAVIMHRLSGTEYTSAPR